MRNFVKIVSILFQDNFHSGIQKSEMKSYNSISRQFSRCVEKRIIKKKKKSKDVYVFSKYREILGTKRMKIRGKLAFIRVTRACIR